MNSKLHLAKRAKNDEFYTRLEDVEAELAHYPDKFRDKAVYLNCDDPDRSAFWEYFEAEFQRLGLKRLIATHYTEGEASFGKEILRGRDGVVRFDLAGDGDFRNDECVELLKQSDIVVTNPPFSLFREFVAQLIEHGKEFLIIGNMNAITYREVWPLIHSGGMRLSGIKAMRFRINSDAPVKAMQVVIEGVRYQSLGNAAWFTTLDDARRRKQLPLCKEYAGNEDNYPRYDNYDAINVNKVKDIPLDYLGVMGVPITFLDKWNPEQFEILGYPDGKLSPGQWNPYVGGKAVYARILVKAVR